MDDNTLESWSHGPPSLTGGHRNQNPPLFTGIDYLRITVFEPVDTVLDVLDTWLDRWSPDHVGVFDVVPAGGRLEALYRSPQPGFEVEQAEDWSGVRLKGQACQFFGLDAILHLLTCFDSCRWHCTRVDFAWDGFPLSTRQVFDLLKAGDVCTKATLDPFPVGDLDADPIDGKGSTVYTHMTPEIRHIDRYVRWYDKRGPVRCELRLGGKYSKALVAKLPGLSNAAASAVAMESLRGLLDITDPADRSERPTRRKLHPSWAEFVEGAEPWRLSVNKAKAEREGLEFIGTIEASVMRCARRLYEARQAFGDQWVLDRIEHYGQPKASLTAIEKLKSVRSAAANKHMAGVTPWPAEFDEDHPF